MTTASRPESIAFCRDVLQADEAIDYKRDNVVDRVRDITGGKGLRVVIDTVGGDVFLQSLDCAAVNGQVVTILGANTGDRGQSLLWRNVTVHYELMAIPAWQEIDPERPGLILARLVDAGLLRPHVSARFPLARVGDAHRALEAGHTVGKIAVVLKDLSQTS